MNIAPGLETATGDLIVQGVFAGGINGNDTNFRKVGEGSLRIEGAGTASTPFLVWNGSVILAGGDNRLGAGSSMRLGNGGTSGRLVLDGVNQTFTSLINVGTGTDNRVVGNSATLSTLTIDNGADTTLDAHLGGSGTHHNNLGLAKSGAGVLTLTGTNTYTGPTTVTNGILQVARQTSLYNNDSASWNADNIIVQSGATLALNVGGAGEFTASDLDVIKTLGTGSDFSYSGGIANTNAGANVLGLTKLGDGTLTLSGSNTFTGSVLVAGGTLEVQTKTSDVAYTINQGATLRIGYTTGGGYANTGMQINGDGVAATSGLYLQGGTSYNASGQIQLLTAPTTIRHFGSGLASIGIFDINGNALNVSSAASGSEIDANIEMVSRGFGMSAFVASGDNTATGDLVINGRLNVGNLGFYKRGDGSILLNQAATGSNAAVRIQGGAIIAGTEGVLGANANLEISAGASLRLNGFDQAARNLAGAGAVVNGSPTTATLTIDSTVDSTFSGGLGGSGEGENNLAFTKTGNGTLTLSGASTHTGDTMVAAGAIMITGSLGNSAVTVQSGATIGGNGTMDGPLTFESGANLDLTVAGAITLTDFGFANLLGWDASMADVGTYNLINGGGTVTLAGTTPTFSNPFDFGNGRQGYFQQGSLQVVIIPEPVTAVMGGLGLLLMMRRRRSH